MRTVGKFNCRIWLVAGALAAVLSACGNDKTATSPASSTVKSSASKSRPTAQALGPLHGSLRCVLSDAEVRKILGREDVGLVTDGPTQTGNNMGECVYAPEDSDERPAGPGISLLLAEDSCAASRAAIEGQSANGASTGEVVTRDGAFGPGSFSLVNEDPASPTSGATTCMPVAGSKRLIAVVTFGTNEQNTEAHRETALDATRTIRARVK